MCSSLGIRVQSSGVQYWGLGFGDWGTGFKEVWYCDPSGLGSRDKSNYGLRGGGLQLSDTRSPGDLSIDCSAAGPGLSASYCKRMRIEASVVGCRAFKWLLCLATLLAVVANP